MVGGHKPAALVVLVLAAVTDVLDGWAARRFRPDEVTRPHRGDWLDPLCDKLFAGAVVVGLYAAHHAPLMLLLLTTTREILQVASLVVHRVVPSLRRMAYEYRAHAAGKATTATQFLTALAFVLENPIARPLAVLSAVLGATAVAIYLNRARVLARSKA